MTSPVDSGTSAVEVSVAVARYIGAPVPARSALLCGDWWVRRRGAGARRGLGRSA